MQGLVPAIMLAGPDAGLLVLRPVPGLHAVPVAAGSGDVLARLCGGRE